MVEGSLGKAYCARKPHLLYKDGFILVKLKINIFYPMNWSNVTRY